MNLKKKIGKVFTSKSVGTGPSSYEKRIYRAAVSQRLRNSGLYERSQNFETRVLPLLCLSVSMTQLGSHLTDFGEILYLSILQNSVDAFQVSLKSVKNNGHFT